MPITATTNIRPMIDRLTELVDQLKTNQEAMQGEQQQPGPDEEQLFRDTKQLKHVARRILSQSSLIAELVTSISSVENGTSSLVYGEVSDGFERTKTEGWISLLAHNRPTTYRSDTNSSSYGSPIFSKRRGSTGSWTIVSDQDDEDSSPNSGSDDDHDILRYRRCYPHSDLSAILTTQAEY